MRPTRKPLILNSNQSNNVLSKSVKRNEKGGIHRYYIVEVICAAQTSTNENYSPQIRIFIKHYSATSGTVYRSESTCVDLTDLRSIHINLIVDSMVDAEHRDYVKELINRMIHTLRCSNERKVDFDVYNKELNLCQYDALSSKTS
jgi:hypothetical protein